MKNKPTAYLCGRMSTSDARDSQWRTDITPLLEELGMEVLNPYDFEPRQLKGYQTGRLPKGYSHWTELQSAAEKHLLDRFLKYMRAVIRFDIKTVRNNTNYLICRWSENCNTGAGTHSELTIAFEEGIPIFCVEESTMPAWARACCTEVFKTFDELKAFLKEEFRK